VRFLRGYPNTLAGKLTTAIFVLMLVGSIMSGLLFYLFQQNISFRNLTRHAQFMNDLIRKSLHHDMLLNQRDDIERSIETIGSSEDITAVRVYDSEGRIVFSNSPAEVGSMAAYPEDVRAIFAGESLEAEIMQDNSEVNVLKYYSPIDAAPSCFAGACHRKVEGQEVLGVLFTSYDINELLGSSRQLLWGALLVGLFLVAVLSLFLFFILHKFVTRPVAYLEDGVKRLAAGSFEEPIALDSRDEMGRLAANFNAMADEIRRYKERLENWAGELQAEVERKTAEIKETQEQLANAEKLASLGRLAAGVAHELNNPLTGVVTFSHLMLERTPEEQELDREDLEMIIEQADRCTRIIKGLLSFSRKGTQEKSSTNMNELVENSISLVRNQSSFLNITVDMEFDPDLPKVTVDSNQIQQVVLNLVSNAVDAMAGEGTITIRTRTIDLDGVKFVETAITDTGPGIFPEHMNKILEPFFTTKSVGKGTGLGLPVSYGIIKRHGGDLLIHSKIGKGSTVTVRLPVREGEPRMEREGERVEFH
jgi:two-component system NtrC family sensor kinase